MSGTKMRAAALAGDIDLFTLGLPNTFGDADRLMQDVAAGLQKPVKAKKGVAETARMSAAVKLQRAFDRERSKSSASYERGKAVLAQARADWEKKQADEKNKQVPVSEAVENIMSALIDKIIVNEAIQNNKRRS